MAKVKIRKNSKLPQNYKTHGDSRKWLEEFFPQNSCAYCWVYHENTDVDHYHPRHMAPNLILEPYNHVLSCIACNRSYKKDYHPQHFMRRNYKKETSGAHILDVRRTDVFNFFKLSSDGSVNVMATDPRKKRWASWHITFFRLNKRSPIVYKRRAILEAIRDMNRIKQNWPKIAIRSNNIEKKLILKTYVASSRLVRKNKLLLHLFNL